MKSMGFFGVPLSTSISNSKSQWKITSAKTGRMINDSDLSRIKVWITLPGKEPRASEIV